MLLRHYLWKEYTGLHDYVIKWKHFRVTGPLWGESTGHRGIPLTKASDTERLCFFDQHLNKGLSKQSRYRWLETPSCSLWRHCHEWCPKTTNVYMRYQGSNIKLMEGTRYVLSLKGKYSMRYYVLTHWGPRRHFQIYFLYRKCMKFD